MQLVSYEGGFGRLDDDAVVPLGRDIMDFLETGSADGDGAERRALAELTLRAPVPRPGKIICVGLNYADHAAEQVVATALELVFDDVTTFIATVGIKPLPRCCVGVGYLRTSLTPTHRQRRIKSACE